MKIKHQLEGLLLRMADKNLQKIVRKMTNWQNHQWLKRADNHTSVQEAEKFSKMVRDKH